MRQDVKRLTDEVVVEDGDDFLSSIIPTLTRNEIDKITGILDDLNDMLDAVYQKESNFESEDVVNKAIFTSPTLIRLFSKGEEGFAVAELSKRGVDAYKSINSLIKFFDTLYYESPTFRQLADAYVSDDKGYPVFMIITNAARGSAHVPVPEPDKHKVHYGSVVAMAGAHRVNDKFTNAGHYTVDEKGVVYNTNSTSLRVALHELIHVIAFMKHEDFTVELTNQILSESTTYFESPRIGYEGISRIDFDKRLERQRTVSEDIADNGVLDSPYKTYQDFLDSQDLTSSVKRYVDNRRHKTDR